MTQEQITETNCIICGDCKDQLARIPDGSVDLIYLDPPFFSGKKWEIIWKDGAEIRGFEDAHFYKVVCVCGEEFPAHHKICSECGASYKDAVKRRPNEIEVYIDWLRPRLEECKRVLSDTGSIYCHLDWHAVHYVKVMMDEIFGRDNFQNDIIWQYDGPQAPSKIKFATKHDTILRYSKNIKKCVVNDLYYYQEIPEKEAKYQKDSDGKYFYTLPKGDYSDKSIEKMDKEGRIYRTKNGKVRIKYFVERTKNGFLKRKKLPDVWTDIVSLGAVRSGEKLGYPTQKPEALLERIIKASSNPGDVILDPFCGCGTTLAVAQKLGREWIGIDENVKAIELSRKRLNGGLNGYK